MQLTREQWKALRRGRSVRVTQDGTELVVVRADLYERLRTRTAPPRRKPRLTSAKLRELAAKHKPPQSWYDSDEESLC